MNVAVPKALLGRVSWLPMEEAEINICTDKPRQEGRHAALQNYPSMLHVQQKATWNAALESGADRAALMKHRD